MLNGFSCYSGNFSCTFLSFNHFYFAFVFIYYFKYFFIISANITIIFVIAGKLVFNGKQCCWKKEFFIEVFFKAFVYFTVLIVIWNLLFWSSPKSIYAKIANIWDQIEGILLFGLQFIAISAEIIFLIPLLSKIIYFLFKKIICLRYIAISYIFNLLLIIFKSCQLWLNLHIQYLPINT